MKGTPVFSVALLVTFGVLAIAGAVSTIVVTLRDGYRRVPSRHA